MNEKELLSQLNKLQNIKPDNQWKNDNREILLNQISGTQEEIKISWLASLQSGFKVLENMLPQQLVRQLSQPAWAVVLIMVIVFGSGIVSLNASRDTKPGDSLYIAKVISEKAQLAITFNEKEKAKLGIEFAGNRAKEITQILAESENVIKEKEAKVEKLTKDFKKEISTVKNRLEKISILSVDNQVCEKESDEETHVFSANLEKGDQRMEISEPGSAELINEQQSNDSADSAQSQTETTAADAIGEDPVLSDAEQTNDITKVLEEAEKLFDEKDYNGTLNKLSEANNIIDIADSSEAENSVASTTDCSVDDSIEVLGINEEANASEDADVEDEADITGLAE